MKRFFAILLVLLCCSSLSLPALADSSLSQLTTDIGIESDGRSAIFLNAQLVLEETVSSLDFPIPVEAEDILLNGEKAQTRTNGQTCLVSLMDVTEGRPGQFSFTLRYTLPNVVSSQDDQMLLELPLLCGFSYPIESLKFTVTFPGELTEDPIFTSSYYQENILSHLTLSVSGRTVTGSSPKLKDHETLMLQMPADEKMFPVSAASTRALNNIDLFTVVTLLLAVAFYLITMFPHIPKKHRRAAVPDGITAGDLSLWFCGKGIDLSLMVLTWAQLGYLRIQVERSGRVLLHKKMDMGNERSSFENRCFQLLFGRRQTVDGTGSHYEALCRSLRSKTPRIQEIYRRGTGNPKVFRLLCLIPALLSGITLAAGLSPRSVFLRVLLAATTTLFAWFLQSGGSCIPLRQKNHLYYSLICGGLWLLLGFLSGEIFTAVLLILWEFLSGIFLAYGGKRTELGQQAQAQIFALRRHMRKVSKNELQQIIRQNPDYFYQMAPYALALNVDRTFARRFSKIRLGVCAYLITGTEKPMTAGEWNKLLRATVRKLDHRANQLPLTFFKHR